MRSRLQNSFTEIIRTPLRSCPLLYATETAIFAGCVRRKARIERECPCSRPVGTELTGKERPTPTRERIQQHLQRRKRCGRKRHSVDYTAFYLRVWRFLPDTRSALGS